MVRKTILVITILALLLVVSASAEEYCDTNSKILYDYGTGPCCSEAEEENPVLIPGGVLCCEPEKDSYQEIIEKEEIEHYDLGIVNNKLITHYGEEHVLSYHTENNNFRQLHNLNTGRAISLQIPISPSIPIQTVSIRGEDYIAIVSNNEILHLYQAEDSNNAADWLKANRYLPEECALGVPTRNVAIDSNPNTLYIIQQKDEENLLCTIQFTTLNDRTFIATPLDISLLPLGEVYKDLEVYDFNETHNHIYFQTNRRILLYPQDKQSGELGPQIMKYPKKEGKIFGIFEIEQDAFGIIYARKDDSFILLNTELDYIKTQIEMDIVTMDLKENSLSMSYPTKNSVKEYDLYHCQLPQQYYNNNQSRCEEAGYKWMEPEQFTQMSADADLYYRQCCGDNDAEKNMTGIDGIEACCYRGTQSVYRGQCGSYPTEICGNNMDDDTDGLVDCADPDCVIQGECCPPGTNWDGSACVDQGEICGNSVDDDNDGLIDCADSDCYEQSCAGSEQTLNYCADEQNEDCVREDEEQNYCDYQETPGNPCYDSETETLTYCNYQGEAYCCALGEEWDGSACVEIPEDCANGIDDNHNGFVDCADPYCHQEPNSADKGCIIGGTKDYRGIPYNCLSDGAGNGLCCAQGTHVEGTGAGAQCVVDAGVELCWDNIDNDLDGQTDCADTDCNLRGGIAQVCSGSSTEARTLPLGRAGLDYYCSYGWSEEEDVGHCCQSQEYFSQEFSQDPNYGCTNDEACNILWDATFPENSLFYNNQETISPPYDQACCPVIRFGEAEYTGRKNIKIY